MSIEPTSLGPNWWVSLNHGGLLIAPPMLKQYFDDDLVPLPAYRAETLRRALTRRAETKINPLLDTVFLEVLGYDGNRWNRNPPADKWSQRMLTGESARPARLYQAGEGQTFPIFTEKPDIRLGLGRGRQSVARVVEWLRKAGLKLALLATEQQWRLIYAGSDFEAWCEWNLDLWFEAGQPSPQVEALRRLLDPAAVPERLLQAVQDSRRGQAELTSLLGERVREAVEKLIQSSAANLDGLNVLPNDIYLAATRMIMRCVVALFAEGKGMLGRDMPAYHDSYSIQGLREQLERIGHGRLDALSHTEFAWPRLISLFRLIHSGSAHPELPMMRYGGTLFEHGDADSHDSILRAVGAFEKAYPCPRDRDVYEILLLLTRTLVKVSQGRGARAIATPVDFSALDTEYIGILYEGLLDYDLKKADETVVFLRMGDEPALPVSALKTIEPGKLKDVFGKLQKKSQLAVAEDEDSEDEESEENSDDESESEDAVEAEPAAEKELRDDTSVQQARDWAIEAVKAARIIRPVRRQTADALRKYQEDVEAAASNLFVRIVRPGEWYLIRFGNTRKGSGTFYTRRELASPTVRRTLAPLAYDETGAPRKPEEILSLKICDPAVGSGSFLISALRYLTGALFESLHHHGRIHESGGNRFYNLGLGSEEYLPDSDDFDDRLKARLRRYVVERCLYGVDLNPLAIELARMSLWIETMEPRLPFGFLDHKLRPGNSLVGCWFDRFEDYPVMAWTREGGDYKYQPVNRRPNWTTAIAAELRNRVKPNLVRMIAAGAQQHLPLAEGKSPSEICGEVRERLNYIHSLSLTEPDEQRREYEQLRREAGFQRLRQAFDTWCSLWFWPGDELNKAPIAADFLAPSEEAMRVIRNLGNQYRFFHWELEFPDVFTRAGAGFDAVVGNPPWETQKPNSLEFFSNIDPLYRSYGKQEALSRQKEYFRYDARHEQRWMAERSRLKALSNWVKYVAAPFGDRITHNGQGKPKFDCGLAARFADSQDLHGRWKELRTGRMGYADADHPFLLQGSADLNTYKMFLELALKIGGKDCRIGMLIPGGIYSDLGSKVLRSHLLSRCCWTHLYCFQNERYVFENVHHSFKITTLDISKGGATGYLNTRFRLGPAQSPTVSELEDDITGGAYLRVPASRIAQFSPSSSSLLEIRSEQDLKLLEKLYANGVLLGDQSDKGWGIQYATEFHMTNDSKLFPPRPEWESKGYRADEYGHWLKGGWRAYSGPENILKRERDLILSADKAHAIAVTDIEDVALPLYEGRMVGQFDFSEKGWVSGKGRKAVWELIPANDKRIRPQYLMRFEDYIGQLNRDGKSKVLRGPKLAFIHVTASTNERTMIATVVLDKPCGNSVPVLASIDPWTLSAVLNSFAYDFMLRVRCSGVNLNYFIVEDTYLPPKAIAAVGRFSLALTGCASLYCRDWLRDDAGVRPWGRSWAITEHERLRIRCILDAAVALSFGLSADDFRHVLRHCDYPESALTQKGFTHLLDPKGFWRVEKEKPPHLRHTVLSLIAFSELERIGLDAFLAMNGGEGWMLPEKLRLADYGLGHDERAKEYQPVASALGDRFYDWQLSQSVEESWEECKRHAELLAQIVPSVPPISQSDAERITTMSPNGNRPTDPRSNPIQAELFGNAYIQEPSADKNK